LTNQLEDLSNKVEVLNKKMLSDKEIVRRNLWNFRNDNPMFKIVSYHTENSISLLSDYKKQFTSIVSNNKIPKSNSFLQIQEKTNNDIQNAFNLYSEIRDGKTLHGHYSNLVGIKKNVESIHKYVKKTKDTKYYTSDLKQGYELSSQEIKKLEPLNNLIKLYSNRWPDYASSYTFKVSLENEYINKMYENIKSDIYSDKKGLEASTSNSNVEKGKPNTVEKSAIIPGGKDRKEVRFHPDTVVTNKTTSKKMQRLSAVPQTNNTESQELGLITSPNSSSSGGRCQISSISLSEGLFRGSQLKQNLLPINGFTWLLISFTPLIFLLKHEEFQYKDKYFYYLQQSLIDYSNYYCIGGNPPEYTIE